MLALYLVGDPREAGGQEEGNGAGRNGNMDKELRYTVGHGFGYTRCSQRIKRQSERQKSTTV